MDRREFLKKSAMAAGLIGVSVTAVACGSDSNSPTGPGGGTPSITGGATGSGHTHSGTITGAQLDSGVAVTITFTGAGHTHSVPLTQQQVLAIATGTRVSFDFTDAHPHMYSFN